MIDPAGLQVLASSLRGVAEEMGAALVRSAHSANIKERRDCSTAVFDPDGRMIAQAEHMPVHLGAMPDAVAACMRLDPRPGDLFCVNDPYTGGTHLPDITLVSVVGGLGLLVSRAHYADVGGMAPASLPVGATELYQEGLIIPPVRLTPEVEQVILANMRNPRERRADLRAQAACHEIGERRLRALAERHGRRALLRGMAELHAASCRRVRAAVARLPDGRHRAADVMEGDGVTAGDVPIVAEVIVRGDRLTVDFTGTAAQRPGNVNCPIAVTRSAVHYVVRLVCDPDLPAAGGVEEAVTIAAPEGCLVNARAPAAVVAGNVETSSRIVDVVLRAFAGFAEVPAMGQGTMNNITFGNHRFTHYETIAGGQGACPNANGPSAVHVAMSNTLNTPVEALELAYPLRVERYALRLGSGGAGRFWGGDGVIREITALEPCRVSIVSERRARGPAGTRGGWPGSPGRNLVDGDEVPAKVTRALDAGESVTIETPGGGGFGAPA